MHGAALATTDASLLAKELGHDSRAGTFLLRAWTWSLYVEQTKSSDLSSLMTPVETAC